MRSGFCRCGPIVLVCGILVLAGADAAEPGKSDLAELIARLGDEQFSLREEAHESLLRIGKPALAALREARASESPERRLRAAALIRGIGDEIVRGVFKSLEPLPPDKWDVEYVMWAIALFLDPELERETVTRSLDEMAAAVRKRIGAGVEPKEMPPAEIVAILISVLKDDYGLAGDEKTYHDPANSSIHRVIQRKKGLPILLSEIAVAVSRRLEIPIVGLPIPGRYMIKYDARQAPEGHRGEDIIINPFEGWRRTSVEELARTVRGFDPQGDLQPSPPGEIAARMLRNMESHARMSRQGKLADAIAESLSRVAPFERQFVPLR